MIGIVVSGLAGWLAGAVENWAADRLPELRTRRTAEGGLSQPEPVRNTSSIIHSFTLPWYFPRRGICPHCGERRSPRTPLLEAATILAFLVSWWRFHAAPLHMAVVCLFTAFLMAVLVIDYERRLVLNIMLAPAAVVALLASLMPGYPTPLQALLGGAIGFGLFLAIWLVGRGAMGMGDVKLAGVIGLMTGYPAVLQALFLGVLFGGAAALALLLSRKAGRKGHMAYAPYLALGTLVTLFRVMG